LFPRRSNSELSGDLPAQQRGATAAARETETRPTIGLNVDGRDTRCMFCYASEVVDEGSGFGLAVFRLVRIGEVPDAD
jgi:hypothetical protein